MTALSPRRTFSGTALKTIACITMLVDHIGAACIEAGILTPGLDAGTLSQDTLSAYPLYRLDMVLRFTGRLAFPLFCSNSSSICRPIECHKDRAVLIGLRGFSFLAIH